MGTVHDVIVVGLGAAGSATVCELATRGVDVLGIDRFRPPHPRGSSHGDSRMIREAYFEHPLYVPLVRRAYERWRALEARSGRSLLFETGGLMIGPADGTLVAGARRSAVSHGLPFRELPARELVERYPPFRPAGDTVALFEPRAGFLRPERCLEAFLELAADDGAELRFDERVLTWRVEGGTVRVRTERGQHEGKKLLIAAGPWTADLLPDLPLPLEVERSVLFHFEPRGSGEDFAPERFPVWVWEYEEDRFWYGFPELGRGVKVARHHGGEACHPDRVRREVGEAEVASMRALLARRLPAAGGPLRDRSVCLYTNTPDGHFVVDVHPRHPEVLVASPCSGHGFKFASVLGELLADLLLEGRSAFDLSPFSVVRFGSPG